MTELTQGPETASLADLNAPVVVFGRDTQGKAHASRFSAAEAPLAERAAGIMGMRVLRLVTEAERALAEGITPGRIFSSGRAFVPFLSASKLAPLEAAPDAYAPPRPADLPEPARSPKARAGRRVSSAGAQPADESPAAFTEPAEAADDVASIRIGSIVLAAEEDAPETWWCATVVAERDANCLELRWSGEWANEPTFTRRRDHLALLPPALAHKLA